MEKLKAILEWMEGMIWINVFVFLRDAFAVVVSSLFLLLHSDKISDFIPMLPDGLKVSDLINVALCNKLMRWSFSLAIIFAVATIIGNLPRKPFRVAPPQPVPVEPNIPKGA
jgi:hypothetical protein